MSLTDRRFALALDFIDRFGPQIGPTRALELVDTFFPPSPEANSLVAGVKLRLLFAFGPILGPSNLQRAIDSLTSRSKQASDTDDGIAFRFSHALKTAIDLTNTGAGNYPFQTDNPLKLITDGRASDISEASNTLSNHLLLPLLGISDDKARVSSSAIFEFFHPSSPPPTPSSA